MNIPSPVQESRKGRPDEAEDGVPPAPDSVCTPSLRTDDEQGKVRGQV